MLATQSKYATTDLPGIGGVTVFVQGALGGQIGSIRGTHPPGPDGTPLTVLGHAMEQAIGTNAAALALKALADDRRVGQRAAAVVQERDVHGADREHVLPRRVPRRAARAERSRGRLVGYDPDEPIDVGNYPWITLRSTFLAGRSARRSSPRRASCTPSCGSAATTARGAGAGRCSTTRSRTCRSSTRRRRRRTCATSCSRTPACGIRSASGSREDYVGYIVPAYNYVLDPERPVHRRGRGRSLRGGLLAVAVRRAARGAPDPRATQVPKPVTAPGLRFLSDRCLRPLALPWVSGGRDLARVGGHAPLHACSLSLRRWPCSPSRDAPTTTRIPRTTTSTRRPRSSCSTRSCSELETDLEDMLIREVWANIDRYDTDYGWGA